MCPRMDAMAHVPDRPANVSPAPTKALKAMNQGDTRTARTIPNTTIDPAVICT